MTAGPSDEHGYYDVRYRAHDELERQLERRFPDLLAAARDHVGPEVTLLCPKGHPMLAVVLGSDPNGHPFLLPAAERQTGTPVASTSHPTATRRQVGSVCGQPGCPRLTRKGFDYCEEHADHGYEGADELDEVKVTLRCPQARCHYAGEHHTERLVVLYAAAASQGVRRVRVPY